MCKMFLTRTLWSGCNAVDQHPSPPRVGVVLVGIAAVVTACLVAVYYSFQSAAASPLPSDQAASGTQPIAELGSPGGEAAKSPTQVVGSIPADARGEISPQDSASPERGIQHRPTYLAALVMLSQRPKVLAAAEQHRLRDVCLRLRRVERYRSALFDRMAHSPVSRKCVLEEIESRILNAAATGQVSTELATRASKYVTRQASLDEPPEETLGGCPYLAPQEVLRNSLPKIDENRLTEADLYVLAVCCKQQADLAVLYRSYDGLHSSFVLTLPRSFDFGHRFLHVTGTKSQDQEVNTLVADVAFITQHIGRDAPLCYDTVVTAAEREWYRSVPSDEEMERRNEQTAPSLTQTVLQRLKARSTADAISQPESQIPADLEETVEQCRYARWQQEMQWFSGVYMADQLFELDRESTASP